MKNVLKIDDYSAVIEFDPEINQFRGEFIGLNGGADFYGTSTKEAQPGPGKNGGKKRSVHGVHAYFFTIFNAAIFIKAWASAVVFQQAVSYRSVAAPHVTLPQ